MERHILHIDMDAFYAAIEQRDHPEWRGKPVIVGSPPDKRGVVSTCSYEARRFGVRSAMASREAFERCPEGIFVKPRMEHYVAVSQSVFTIFNEITPLVEGLSVDEAFLDVTHVQRLWGTPKEIAQLIKTRIKHELGLTCSVGISTNKSLAKIASEERKPDGLFEVPREQQAMLTWLGQKPLKVLWGVGPKCATLLERAGLKMVRDLQSVNPGTLGQILTPLLAEHLLALAFGKDVRPVVTEHIEKSYSREHTYPEDTLDVEDLRRQLWEIAKDVGRRLREAGLWARTARIKIRYTGFRTVTRQQTLAFPVCDDFALRDAAWKLFDAHLEPSVPVRLIGFGADQLTASPSPYDEDDLFANQVDCAHPRMKEETLSRTLDALRSRFGDAITDAMHLSSADKKPEKS